MDEKLRYTLRIYKNSFLLLAGITLVPVVVGSPLTIFYAFAMEQNPMDMTPEMPSASEIVLYAVGIILGMITAPLYFGAIYHAIHARTLGEPVTVLDAYRAALRSFVSLAIVTIVLWAGVVFGSFFCLIPGILLAVKWSFAYPIIITARREPGENPLTLSWKMTKGYGWQIFGAALMFIVPSYLVYFLTVPLYFVNVTLANLAAIPFGYLMSLMMVALYILVYVCYREATLGPSDEQEKGDEYEELTEETPPHTDDP